MEKKELLSEERYQSTKSKISMVAIIILVIGLLVGGSLIATGVVKSINAEKQITEVRSVEDIQTELDGINNQLAKLKAQQNTEFNANGFSENFYKLGNEIDKLQNKKSELNMEISKIKSGYYDNKFKNSVSTAPFYMFGAFIIISSLMVSGSVFMFTKRREMLAFSMQQIMPVATEGLEKVAPTVSKVGKEMMEEMAPAYGKMAKEISKGIKKGMKEVEEEE